MPHFTRRQFLCGASKAIVAASAVPMLTGCPKGMPPYTPTDKDATVAAVRGLDLRAMTRESLEAHGGAGAIVGEGETVFIKPNFGAFGMVKYNPVQAGDAVKPEIVLTVAEECLKAGAAEVIIGDAGQAVTYSWQKVVTLDGVNDMATEAARLSDSYPGKVTLACLNADSPDWDLVPSWTKLNNLYISSLVNRADRVISVAVLKSHRWTYITGAMKNFVGVTSTYHYGMGIQWRFLLHDAGIDQCFLDIVNAVKPDFSIVDCSVCCEGNGPHVLPGYWGESVDMRDRLGSWLLLSGADPAAVDATAARVISHDVNVIPHLQKAYGMGIGQILEERITIDGATLGELVVDWKPADITEGFGEVLLPGLMLIT